MFDDAGPLFDCEDLIRFDVREFRRHSAWPENLNRIDFSSLSKAEVESRILRGLIANPTFSLIVENQLSC